MDSLSATTWTNTRTYVSKLRTALRGGVRTGKEHRPDSDGRPRRAGRFVSGRERPGAPAARLLRTSRAVAPAAGLLKREDERTDTAPLLPRGPTAGRPAGLPEGLAGGRCGDGAGLLRPHGAAVGPEVRPRGEPRGAGDRRAAGIRAQALRRPTHAVGRTALRRPRGRRPGRPALDRPAGRRPDRTGASASSTARSACRSCCGGWASCRRSRPNGPSSGTRRRSPNGSARTGPASKKARRLGAAVVFYDETGFLTHPHVGGAWAPVGVTPTTRHRVRHRERVSVIGSLTVSPNRRRCGLYCDFLRGRGVRRRGSDRPSPAAAADSGLSVGCRAG